MNVNVTVSGSSSTSKSFEYFCFEKRNFWFVLNEDFALERITKDCSHSRNGKKKSKQKKLSPKGKRDFGKSFGRKRDSSFWRVHNNKAIQLLLLPLLLLLLLCLLLLCYCCCCATAVIVASSAVVAMLNVVALLMVMCLLLLLIVLMFLFRLLPSIVVAVNLSIPLFFSHFISPLS